MESKVRLFADDCVTYRKILNIKNVEKLQAALDRLGDWAVENEIKINRGKVRKFLFKPEA
jgi:hypothetical protein